MKLILPQTLVDRGSIDYPLFFLAGPALGGGDWRKRCCAEIAKHLAEFSAVVPCPWKEGNKFPEGIWGQRDVFARQTAWEHYYLKFVSAISQDRHGVILFWLPAESKEHPRADGQPYARDTYGELARWSTRSRVVIGAEPDFPGLSVIRANLELDCLKIPIHPTLEEAVEAAVKWVKP